MQELNWPPRRAVVSVPAVLSGLLLVALGLPPTVAGAADVTWTGLGRTERWRAFGPFPFDGGPVPANWALAGFSTLPENGDSLRFVGAGNWASNFNDFDDLTIAGLRFDAGADAFTLLGNGFTSNGDIVNESARAQLIGMPVTLGASQTWRNAGTGSLRFTALPVLGAHALTLDGASLDVPDGSLSLSDGSVVRAIGGAQAHLFRTIIAPTAGSSGTLELDGPTTNWTTELLHVGRAGTGTVHVTNGATLMNTLSGQPRVPGDPTLGNAALGVEAGAEGTVTVDGGRWLNRDFYGELLLTPDPAEFIIIGRGDSGRIDVGVEGTGVLNVIGGGKVTFATLNVGRGANSLGTVTVDGLDSALTMSEGTEVFGQDGTDGSVPALNIGVGGEGTLTITNGGLVSHFLSRIGVNAGAKGSVVVDGGRLDSGALLEVGRGGTGSLRVVADGVVNTQKLAISAFGNVQVGSGGTLNLGVLALEGGGDGAFELLDDTAVINTPVLEMSGDSAFSVPNGRQLTIEQIQFPDVPGSTARLTVRGADTSLSSTRVLDMQSVGAVVDVLDGATLSLSHGGGRGLINVANGSKLMVTGTIGGRLRVDGVGSTLEAVGPYNFGDATFSGGARVRTQELFGFGAALSGDVRVTGLGTTWDDLGGYVLGTGSLTVDDGARVNLSSTRFLFWIGGDSTRLTVDGQGSRLDLGGVEASFTFSQDTGIVVRGGGSARLGAITTSDYTTVQIEVDGAGSRLDIGITRFLKGYQQQFGGPLDTREVGENFSVTGGGALHFERDLSLGAGFPVQPPAPGRHETLVLVDGANSSLSLGADFDAGSFWPTHLTVKNGGRLEALTAGSRMDLDDAARVDLLGGTLSAQTLALRGRITQDSAAVLDAERFDIEGGHLEGGTLDMDRIGLLRGHGTVAAGLKGGLGHVIEVVGDRLALGADTAVGAVDYRGTLDVGSSIADLASPGTVHLGSVTRIAAGGVLNSARDIAIDDGDLHLDGTLNAPRVRVNGGTLDGAGVLNGTLSLGASALTLVAPGNSPGTLRIKDDLLSGPQVRYLLEIDSLTAFDVIAVDGDAQFDGGTLVFHLAPDFVPQLGARFDWLQVQGTTSGLDTVQWLVETLNLEGDAVFVGDGNGIVDPRFAPGLRFALEGGSLTVEPVPLPGSLALFPFGLALLARRRRGALRSAMPRTAPASVQV